MSQSQKLDFARVSRELGKTWIMSTKVCVSYFIPSELPFTEKLPEKIPEEGFNLRDTIMAVHRMDPPNQRGITRDEAQMAPALNKPDIFHFYPPRLSLQS